MSLRYVSGAAIAAGAILSFVGQAQSAVISSGLYRLHNHPDSVHTPPPYGGRFDELYDATGGHDVFTLDFDHASSAAYMEVDLGAGTVHIFGVALGGRDVGGSYAADPYLGLYGFEFLYDIGVGGVPGDDDVWVAAADPGHANFGYITTPLSDTIDLTDEAMGGYSLRIGDENNDAGHRGFPGISVWGWMSYVTPNGIVHVPETDWICTAELIPAPASVGLVGAGAVLCLRRGR